MCCNTDCFCELDFAITSHRSASRPLPTGIAPPISSDAFRRECCETLPASSSRSNWFSQEARGRQSSSLKGTAHVVNPSATINLGTARPALQYSPWESIAVTAQNVRRRAPTSTGADRTAKQSQPATVSSCVRGESGYDLDLAMNYGFPAGSPQLLRFVTEHVDLVHRPPYQDWQTSLTCGTTSALEILFRMLCDRGACILAESRTYAGAPQAAKPLGISVLGVEMDELGLRPDDLDAKLRTWNTAAGPKPFILYTIPTGQNPTGVTQSPQRREAVYKVAEEHDLCIIEDDPYYFLQFAENAAGADSIVPTSGEYLKQLQPSYLSLDRSGRVIRLDATSKILAPGLRCGWATGCSEMIAEFLNYTEFSTVSPSGPSQLLLYKLLDETWGHAGFLLWLMQLSQQYRHCRDTMLAACQRHLPSELCQYHAPQSGMFLWIRVKSSSHHLYLAHEGHSWTSADCASVENRIYDRAKAKGVQISKGSWFLADEQAVNEIAFRLTFAAAPADALELAIQRFADALAEEFQHSLPSDTRD